MTTPCATFIRSSFFHQRKVFILLSPFEHAYHTYIYIPSYGMLDGKMSWFPVLRSEIDGVALNIYRTALPTTHIDTFNFFGGKVLMNYCTYFSRLSVKLMSKKVLKVALIFALHVCKVGVRWNFKNISSIDFVFFLLHDLIWFNFICLFRSLVCSVLLFRSFNRSNN